MHQSSPAMPSVNDKLQMNRQNKHKHWLNLFWKTHINMLEHIHVIYQRHMPRKIIGNACIYFGWRVSHISYLLFFMISWYAIPVDQAKLFVNPHSCPQSPGPSVLCQGLKPLAGSNTRSPRFTDSLSNLSILIGWKIIQNRYSSNAQKLGPARGLEPQRRPEELCTRGAQNGQPPVGVGSYLLSHIVQVTCQIWTK